MKSCDNCRWLHIDCVVEPEDRRRSAENCDQYSDIEEYHDKQWQAYMITGEWPIEMD